VVGLTLEVGANVLEVDGATELVDGATELVGLTLEVGETVDEVCCIVELGTSILMVIFEQEENNDPSNT
jgi:hypothetical protein